MTEPFDAITNVLLGTPVDACDYYRHFVFTVAAINSSSFVGDPVWVGLPRFKRQNRLGALLVAWHRMQRIDADTYGIAEVAEDARGMRRIFFYLATLIDELHYETETRVFQFAFDSDGQQLIAPLDPDDWLLSDPLFSQPPDPIYWQLFWSMPEEHQAAAAMLDRKQRETANGELLFDLALEYLRKQETDLRSA